MVCQGGVSGCVEGSVSGVFEVVCMGVLRDQSIYMLGGTPHRNKYNLKDTQMFLKCTSERSCCFVNACTEASTPV